MSKVRDIITGIKKWAAMRMFRLVVRWHPSLVTSMVGEASRRQLPGIVMEKMERMGLAHCLYCPKRFNLRLISRVAGIGPKGAYVCHDHMGRARQDFQRPKAAA